MKQNTYNNKQENLICLYRARRSCRPAILSIIVVVDVVVVVVVIIIVLS